MLTEAKPYLTLSSDFTSIILDGSKASGANLGVQTFTLTVNSKLFAASVTQATYSFKLDLKACEVSEFTFSQNIN